jgi:hypothetical protein
VVAPLLFGALIGTGKASNVFIGDLVGALLMAAAGCIELVWGVKAERQSLENVAVPLSAQAAEPGYDELPAGQMGTV